jgi:hypothetical protein
MKKPNLFASIAAALLTAASLGAVNHNVQIRPVAATEINGSRVFNLAPVEVHPDADTLREAALLVNEGAVGLATIPTLGHAGGGMQPFSLIGSQLAMPYYSFGNKFGRSSKE